jgi:IS4 transposase
MRFKLFPRAVKLIALSTTYQEHEETIKEFEVKSHKQKVHKPKPVKYWGIIAITDGLKIKVILRKIGDNGQLHFWSIVPAWTTNKYRDIKFVTTMKGNPDED